MMNKRQFFLGMTALVGTQCPAWAGLGKPTQQAQPTAFDTAMQAIEQGVGGRLGVAVRDTETGRSWHWRGAERFPMCSTFKLLLAAQALRWSELGRLSMDQRLDYPRSALVEYSPVTELRVDSGMTVRELCEATVTLSDNTAANVLLAKMDEPAGFTRFVRQLGDRHTRLDRYEPALNTAIPGDLRDTTTPLAMLASMESVCLGEGLADSSRQQLRQWLLDCKTGDATLRAGAPGWTVGNKTGGGHETRSDVGIFWPPGVVNRGKPVLVTAYLTECPAVPKDRDAALASVAREVVRILT